MGSRLIIAVIVIDFLSFALAAVIFFASGRMLLAAIPLLFGTLLGAVAAILYVLSDRKPG